MNGRASPFVPREAREAMRSKGDNDGADTSLRIIVAIGEPPTEARQ